MQAVIRNNEYICTENIIFGDVLVAEKPHEDAFLDNGHWVIDLDLYLSRVDSQEALQFLNETDWQIIRHKEEQDLGLETSLSDEGYQELITKRQEARRKVNNDIK